MSQNRFQSYYSSAVKQRDSSFASGLTNSMADGQFFNHEGFWIFAFSFLLNIMMAYVLYFHFQIGNSDALSRTANAFYVLFSREPHLAAVGFVWPPLPSFLQLPLLPLTKYFGFVNFTGNIVSSIFGALCLVLMNRLLAKFRFSSWIRWILIGLLQFHPDTFYLFSSGMAEPIFLFFVIATFLGMIEMPLTMRSWVIAGLSLTGAFFVRYESLAMMAGVGFAVIVLLFNNEPDWIKKTEGWLFAVLLPPAYGIGLWLFFNWTLMGDPLFFLRSVYSLSNAPDIAKIAGLTHPLYLAYGNIIEAIRIGIIRSFQQNPAYPVMGLLAFFTIVRSKKRNNFSVFIVMISITAFTILQVYLGSLANWMRYWFYAAPFGLVMAGIVHQNLRSKWRIPFYLFLIFLFISGTPISLMTMRNEKFGGDEQRISALLLSPEKENAIKEKDGFWVYLHDAPIVAEVVDQYAANGLVMVDSSSSFSVITSVRNPKGLFISNDTDYFKALANPIGVVAYMLVLDPDTGGVINTINITYPTLFENGAPWATLVWDSGESTMNHWRIYRIHPVESSHLSTLASSSSDF
jgi:hypothetical protein